MIAQYNLYGVRARSLAVNDLSRLELAYNSCIDMLLRFFARRNELVRQMFGADILKEAFDLERDPERSLG